LHVGNITEHSVHLQHPSTESPLRHVTYISLDTLETLFYFISERKHLLSI